jgi:hypothetical protein
MKKDREDLGSPKITFAAATEEFNISLRRTRPLHIRPFGNVFLMNVGEN